MTKKFDGYNTGMLRMALNASQMNHRTNKQQIEVAQGSEKDPIKKSQTF